MREWLTVIISLLIAGILLDGIRRVRRARRENLRVSRNVRRFDEEGVAEPKDVCSQPRVVSYRDNRDAETLTRSMRASFARSKVTVGAPKRTPEQASLDLKESVPMLMDSVEDHQGQDEKQPRRSAQDFTQAPSWAEPEPDDYEMREEEDIAGGSDEPGLGSVADLDDNNAAASQRREPQSWSDAEADPDATSDLIKSTATGWQPENEPDVDGAGEWIEPEEVLIINLMAPAGEQFDGGQLLEALLEQGMRFGSMNIFHRHKYDNGSGPVHFSLANMVVPGTFELSAMSEFSTPGVSIFMGLPNDDSLAAFDCMAITAQALAKRLGGELKDENRSVMTRQTIEHCRQRVIEFERKQRLVSGR